MKFTYQELTDLREILQDEINRWADNMHEFEEKNPGTEKEWKIAIDCTVDMPDQNTEIFDSMNSSKCRAEWLLKKIDRAEFE